MKWVWEKAFILQMQVIWNQWLLLGKKVIDELRNEQKSPVGKRVDFRQIGLVYSFTFKSFKTLAKISLLNDREWLFLSKL